MRSAESNRVKGASPPVWRGEGEGRGAGGGGGPGAREGGGAQGARTFFHLPKRKDFLSRLCL